MSLVKFAHVFGEGGVEWGRGTHGIANAMQSPGEGRTGETRRQRGQ